MVQPFHHHLDNEYTRQRHPRRLECVRKARPLARIICGRHIIERMAVRKDSPNEQHFTRGFRGSPRGVIYTTFGLAERHRGKAWQKSLPRPVLLMRTTGRDVLPLRCLGCLPRVCMSAALFSSQSWIDSHMSKQLIPTASSKSVPVWVAFFPPHFGISNFCSSESLTFAVRNL